MIKHSRARNHEITPHPKSLPKHMCMYMYQQSTNYSSFSALRHPRRTAMCGKHVCSRNDTPPDSSKTNLQPRSSCRSPASTAVEITAPSCRTCSWPHAELHDPFANAGSLRHHVIRHAFAPRQPRRRIENHPPFLTSCRRRDLVHKIAPPSSTVRVAHAQPLRRWPPLASTSSRNSNACPRPNNGVSDTS